MQIIEAMTGPDSPGEERLIQTLAGELDDAYTLFRRVLLPRATDAIDTVLVGPFGVLVITTHEYAGTYACEGDEWFHSPDGGQSWQLSTENPIKQALYDHIQLKSYLAREGLHGVPLEKASAALKEGVRQTFLELGIQSVPRNWLDVVAVRV